MYNLLNEALLEVSGSRGSSVSLPELFVALSGDAVSSLVRAQRHQEDAIYMTLCLLGAAARHQMGADDTPLADITVAQWRSALIALTGRECPGEPRWGEWAWDLVAEEPTRPAFLQYLLLEGETLSENYVATPDGVDVLGAAQNHLRKKSLMQKYRPEDWVFALMSSAAQDTGSGSGHTNDTLRGPYRSCARACIELRGTARMSHWWLRSMDILRQIRLEARDDGSVYQSEGGVVCIWARPNRDILYIKELDVCFLDQGSALRLFMPEATKNRILAVRMQNKTRATLPGEHPGNAAARTVVRDPWTPLKITEKKGVLTEGNWGAKSTSDGSGGPLPVFTAEFLAGILVGVVSADTRLNTRPSRMASPHGSEDVSYLHCGALTRYSQAQQDTYEVVDINIPPQVRASLFGGIAIDHLSWLSTTAIQDAGSVQHYLSTALVRVSDVVRQEASSGMSARERPSMGGMSEILKRTFTNDWSGAYFAWLWSSYERVLSCREDQRAALMTHQAQWRQMLFEYGGRALREAVDKLSRNGAGYQLMRACVENEIARMPVDTKWMAK